MRLGKVPVDVLLEEGTHISPSLLRKVTVKNPICFPLQIERISLCAFPSNKMVFIHKLRGEICTEKAR